MPEGGRFASFAAVTLSLLWLTGCATRPAPAVLAVMGAETCGEVFTVVEDWPGQAEGTTHLSYSGRLSGYSGRLADFLELVRLSSCPYTRAVIAFGPLSPGVPSYGGAAAFQIERFARFSNVPWEVGEDMREDSELPSGAIRVTFLAPTVSDWETAITHFGGWGSEPVPAADMPTMLASALETPSEEGLFAAALAEVCFAAALSGRPARDVAAQAGLEHAGSGKRFEGWRVTPGAKLGRGVSMTTSGYMCSVGSRLGDPWTLATYALGVLDALAPTRYPGSCPDRLLCRTLPDGRIMVLQLHLAGGEVPERYRGTAEEGGGAGLGGVVTTMVATPERLAVVAAEWHAARARLVERSGWTAVDDATGPDGGR